MDTFYAVITTSPSISKLQFMNVVEMSIVFDFQFQLFAVSEKYCNLSIRHVSTVYFYIQDFKTIKFLGRPSLFIEYD